MKKAAVTPNIIVDCSHGNSSRQPQEQGRVLADVLEQVVAGEQCIVGTMLESNLQKGHQQVRAGAKVKPGLSVTDACLGWEGTKKLITAAYERVSKGGGR
jgi:3-deoxy-7-phosphoheptulonate synthase